MKKSIIYFAFLFLISGCISEFSPFLKRNNEYFIIDAKLSDKEGVVVKLSTIKGGETMSYPLSIDASVEVVDDSGDRIVLNKIKQGIYTSSTNGIPGRNYSLDIKTANGKEYLSSYERMYPEVPIENISPSFELHPSGNSNDNIPGIQFYLDLNTSLNESRFFRWSYAETWIEKTRYRWMSYGTWDKKGNLVSISQWPLDSEHNRKCWHASSSNEVIVKSTDKIKPDLQKGIPVFFSDDLTYRFSVGYSVEVSQYSITPSAFLYYTQLQKNNELTGSLYDPIPAFIESNIYNKNDPSDEISGFFVVSSVAKKRIFIKPAELIPYNYTFGALNIDCQDSIAYSNAIASRIHTALYFMDIYDYIPASPMTPMTIQMATRACFDCEFNGGTVQKPPYWDDRYSGK